MREPWGTEDELCLGLSLLGLLLEGAPGVFEAPKVREGHKTVYTFRLTDRALDIVGNATEFAAATASPRYGMMVGPPRPWAYQGGADAD